MILPKLLKT